MPSIKRLFPMPLVALGSLLLSPCTGNAQIKIINTVLINPDSSNLYIGVENLIEVLNTSSKNYSLTAKNAVISSGARGHISKSVQPGTDTLYVIQAGKVIASKVFHVDYLPSIVAKVGNISKSVATKEMIIASEALYASAGNYDFQRSPRIISYVVTIKSNHIKEDDAVIPNNSNLFSKRVIAAFRLLRSGDTITFDNIKMQGGSGVTITLKPLTMTIQ